MNAVLGLGLLLGLAATGCASSARGEVQSMPGAVVFTDDEVGRHYNVTVEQARRAVEMTLNEMQFSNVTWDDEGDHYEIEGDGADDQNIDVDLHQVSSNRTFIRVDIDGDFEGQRAIDFHQRLQRHLQMAL